MLDLTASFSLGVARRQNHGRAAGRGLFAFVVLEPDFAIDQVMAVVGVLLDHLAARDDFCARLIHPAILHAEFAEPSVLACENGHQMPEEGILQRAMKNYA